MPQTIKPTTTPIKTIDKIALIICSTKALTSGIDTTSRIPNTNINGIEIHQGNSCLLFAIFLSFSFQRANRFGIEIFISADRLSILSRTDIHSLFHIHELEEFTLPASGAIYKRNSFDYINFT
jgi:hypothetical protein